MKPATSRRRRRSWSRISEAGRGSAERSRAFYRRLGPTGLAIRTRPEWDALNVQAVLELLPPAGRVLDDGCGYGRIAIPLAGLGYGVTGFDISPNLLRAGRREAAARGVAVRFDEGSMTDLPYGDARFDVVISLWTAFYELVDEREQIAALGEIWRVLRPGGVGIIEGPVHVSPTQDEIGAGTRYGPEHGIVVSDLGSSVGHRLEHFAHDEVSLGRLAAAVGITDPRVSVRDWGGRDRQLLMFSR